MPLNRIIEEPQRDRWEDSLNAWFYDFIQTIDNEEMKESLREKFEEKMALLPYESVEELYLDHIDDIS